MITKAYRIEVRDPITGYWNVHKVIKLNYQYETVTKTRKIFFWMSRWNETKISNQEEADIEARKKAVLQARYFQSFYDVRIFEEIEDKWRGETFVFSLKIWENGVWEN